jgi:outer membrane receptor protein involved in Fe transport
MNYSPFWLPLFAAFASVSLAQDVADGDPIGLPQLDPVIITGSILERTGPEPSPSVIVLDRAKLERTGYQTLSGVLSRLPQNSVGISEFITPGRSFTRGAAAASLRGLGVSSTLVLINGRRVAPFAFASGGIDTFVDLNSIPLAAIERVEILREGASAIYGSDAVAGVINVILKERYSGLETETQYGNTTNNDSAEFRQSFVSGVSAGKLHLLLSGHYYRRNPLAAVDRGFSASADQRRRGGADYRSLLSNPGTVFVGEDAEAKAVPPGSDGRLTDAELLPGLREDGSYRNLFENNSVRELISETERWGGLLKFRYELTPQLEFFGEASYQAQQSKTRIESAGLDGAGDGLVVPADNPFNPIGEDVDFVWRATEVGPRRSTTDVDTYRALAGLRAHGLPGEWTAEAAFLYSENNVLERLTDGFLSTAAVQAALDDPDPATALNVFGDGEGINSRNTLRRLVVRPRTDGLSYLYGVDARASGRLFDLPAGPVRLGLGGEYREEFLLQRFSLPAGAVIGRGLANAEGGRDVRSLFFEASLPIAGPGFDLPMVRALEFTLAERFDDYSDFGFTAKPKLGLEWKPCAGLRLRGVYAEAFRAPSLPQLYSGTVSGFGSVTNPQTGLTNSPRVNTVGNPDLEAELSYAYFLGGTIEPPFAPGLRLTVDYFHIEQRNQIGLPSAQDVVDRNADGDVQTAGDGRIVSVTRPYSNFGQTVVEGWDLELSYRLETRFGSWEFASSLAYISRFDQALELGVPAESQRDRLGFPEFKMVHSLFYIGGGFEAGVTVNYVDSYDDDELNNRGEPRTVGSWTTVDLQLSYEWRPASASDANGVSHGRWRWLDDLKLTVGCLNVGDCDPPFLNVTEGYDAQVADAAGRFIYASVRKKFW